MVKKDSMKTDKKIEEIIEKVRRGAVEDGFSAKDLIAYPNQSDRYMKPAIKELTNLLNTEVREAVEEAEIRGEQHYKDKLKLDENKIREEAVKGFVYWFNFSQEANEFWGWDGADVDLNGAMETYLTQQSLDKGDTDE